MRVPLCPAPGATDHCRLPEQTNFAFDSLRTPSEKPVLESILHPEDGSQLAEDLCTSGPLAKVHSKYVLTDKLWGYLQAYAKKHKEAGNGFGFGLVDKTKVPRTLSARYKGRSNRSDFTWEGQESEKINTP